jgi:MoaA/NifB/PqqE/SkfB family radical SAM enzyme
MERKLKTKKLEYNIVEHCNLKCKHCDHGSPFLSEQYIETKAFENDLYTLKSVLHTKELKLVGGEPLLHPHLIDFLQISSRLGIADIISLGTNGILLHLCSHDIWQLIDRLCLSIYPNINIKMSMQELSELSKKYNFKLEIFKMDVFRHTLLNNQNRNKEVIKKIYDICEIRKVYQCHTVRNGMYYKCPQAAFMKSFLKEFKIPNIKYESDGIIMHHGTSLLKDISNYIKVEEPLNACAFCLGTSGKWFKHKQMGKQDLKKFIELPNHINNLINWPYYNNSL